jgi:hypothetical protein
MGSRSIRPQRPYRFPIGVLSFLQRKAIMRNLRFNLLTFLVILSLGCAGLIFAQQATQQTPPAPTGSTMDQVFDKIAGTRLCWLSE